LSDARAELESRASFGLIYRGPSGASITMIPSCPLGARDVPRGPAGARSRRDSGDQHDGGSAVLVSAVVDEVHLGGRGAGAEHLVLGDLEQRPPLRAPAGTHTNAIPRALAADATRGRDPSPPGDAESVGAVGHRSVDESLKFVACIGEKRAVGLTVTTPGRWATRRASLLSRCGARLAAAGRPLAASKGAADQSSADRFTRTRSHVKAGRSDWTTSSGALTVATG